MPCPAYRLWWAQHCAARDQLNRQNHQDLLARIADETLIVVGKYTPVTRRRIKIRLNPSPRPEGTTHMPTFSGNPSTSSTPWSTGDRLTLYASQSDAVAGINAHATVTAGAEGLWTYTDPTLELLWAKTPAGTVFEIIAADGTATAQAIAAQHAADMAWFPAAVAAITVPIALDTDGVPYLMV